MNMSLDSEHHKSILVTRQSDGPNHFRNAIVSLLSILFKTFQIFKAFYGKEMKTIYHLFLSMRWHLYSDLSIYEQDILNLDEKLILKVIVKILWYVTFIGDLS